MKSLAGLLQQSNYAWGTKLAAVALIITVALFSLPAGAGDDSDHERGKHHAPQIEGSWFQTIEQEGGPTKALLSFSAGGALVFTVNFPGSTQTAFHGTWVQKGRREFVWTSFSFGYDASGAHAVTVRVHEELTLARDGQSYSGHAKVDLLDPEGNPITELPPATTHGMRINAE